MTLAPDARDFDQDALVDDRRSAQQRTRDRYLVLLRESPDQRAGRVGDNGQSLGQIGAGSHPGVRNEIDEDAVEQIDVIGSEVRRPCRNSPAIRRATSARRLGSPCLTISSNPGINDVATDMKHTQARHGGGFFRQFR